MRSSGSMCGRTVRRQAAAAAAFSILLAPAGARAQAVATQPEEAERVVSTVPRDEVPASGLAPAEGAIRLPLEDAITIALRRNLGLRVERYDRAQFRLQVDENLGIYDLQLGSQAWSNEETQPTTSELAGAEVLTREQQNANVSVSQLTPWGGLAGFAINAFRQEDNSIFSNPNPFFVADANFSLTQPLLRGFGVLPTERGIRVARLNSAISREVFEQQVSATLQAVEVAYWDLVEALQQLEVAQESLALARELHQMNRVRVEVGTLAPLELLQSEVGIATREEEIIRAQAAVGDAEDRLRRLLHLEEGELWERPIVPTTEPDIDPVDIDLQAAIAAALAERPELRNQQLRLDLLQLEAAFFRNQTLPRLDLTSNYGYSGIAGDVRNPQGEIVAKGNLADAFEQLSDRDFDGWRVQLDFAYPLQNRQARARRAIAELDLEQGRVEEEQLAEVIRTEVRAAVRGVRTAAQQIESARASRRLAEQNLEAERRRYENGLSTSFQVLEIQEDLIAARSRLVSAIAGYRRALAEYWRSTGRLLEADDVELIDPLRVDDVDRFDFEIGELEPSD